MYLEILPHRCIAPVRLLLFLQSKYAGAKKVNIILPIEFKEEVDEIIHKAGDLKNKIILSERSLIHQHCYYVYYQFDFLRNISFNPNYSYISSLRFPRTSKHIKNWQDGRTTDNLLSLIALNNNRFTIFSPATKQWTTVSDSRTSPNGFPGETMGYSEYSTKVSGKKRNKMLDEFAKTLYDLNEDPS